MADKTFNQKNIELFKSGKASIRFKRHGSMTSWHTRVKEICEEAGYSVPYTTYTWKYVYVAAGQVHWCDTLGDFVRDTKAYTHIDYKAYHGDAMESIRVITNYEIY